MKYKNHQKLNKIIKHKTLQEISNDLINSKDFCFNYHMSHFILRIEERLGYKMRPDIYWNKWVKFINGYISHISDNTIISVIGDYYNDDDEFYKIYYNKIEKYDVYVPSTIYKIENKKQQLILYNQYNKLKRKNKLSTTIISSHKDKICDYRIRNYVNYFNDKTEWNDEQIYQKEIFLKNHKYKYYIDSTCVMLDRNIRKYYMLKYCGKKYKYLDKKELPKLPIFKWEKLLHNYPGPAIIKKATKYKNGYATWYKNGIKIKTIIYDVNYNIIREYSYNV